MPVTRRIARPVVRKIVRAVNQAVAGMFDEASFYVDFLLGTLDPRISFSRASGGTRINSSGVLELVGTNAPRFDYDPVTLQPRGLLIEEQRTNSIRNSTMQGAVAGSPGTLPTNWAATPFPVNGLNQEIIGTGVEKGVQYIDIRIYGVTTASGAVVLYFDLATTASAASPSQTWSLSSYVKIVAGSTSNILALDLALREADSASAFLRQTLFACASGGSVLTRYAGSATTGASTAFVSSGLRILYASGAAIDITLRIGLPQLELGAKESSVIPTSGAAATRAADIAPCTGTNFSSWYRADEGTLFVEGSIPFVGGSTFPAFASVDDGTSSNAMEWSMWDAASDSVRFVVWNGGVNQASIVAGTYAAAAALKLAGAYKVNDFAASYNGAGAVTDTAGTLPTVTVLRIGQNRAAGNPLNGHIRRIAYWPRRLSNAELQVLTS